MLVYLPPTDGLPMTLVNPDTISAIRIIQHPDDNTWFVKFCMCSEESSFHVNFDTEEAAVVWLAVARTRWCPQW